MRVRVVIAALAASGMVAAGAPAGATPAVGEAGNPHARASPREASLPNAPRTAASLGGASRSTAPREPVIRVRTRGTPTTSGRPTTYVLEARNPGGQGLSRAVVNQLLPPNLAYRGATPRPATVTDRQLRWTVPIPAGETVRIRVRGTVDGDDSWWNRFGVGERPRVDTTACVAVDAGSAVSECHTVSARAQLVVPWWRSLYALLGSALILTVGVPAGIVLLRRRRAATRAFGPAVGPARSCV